jgi:tRNA(adenine34) deaminase
VRKIATRTARIGRVMYALGSPIRGGASRWNILGDEMLSQRIPLLFRAPPPQVTTGVLVEEAEQVWRDWNPLVWRLIRMRRLIQCPKLRSCRSIVRLLCDSWRSVSPVGCRADWGH